MPSSIEWTDETWNPVTGCTRVSPGCDRCYMFALYPRLRGMGVPGYETSPEDIRLLPERLQAPLFWKRPRRIFVNSMADLFHPKVPFNFVLQVFTVMVEAAEKRGHIFQVLTKRPGRAAGWWNQYQGHFPGGWPPQVWLVLLWRPRNTLPDSPFWSVSQPPYVSYLQNRYWNASTYDPSWRGELWTG